MPIAEELGKRSDGAGMAECRSLTKAATQLAKAKQKRGTEVPELDRMLLGPHASLPRLARMQRGNSQTATTDLGSSTATLKLAEPKKVKTRKHKIFTSACGYVDYAG